MGSTTRWLVFVLLGACLLTVGAKIQVPGPVPATLQTLVVYAMATTCGSRLTVAAVTSYLLAGLAGIPVFANTPPLLPGPAYFAGPTGGFLVGMLVVGAALGHVADGRSARRSVTLIPILVVSAAALFSVGFVWLSLFATVDGGPGVGWERAWKAAVAPFIPGEVVKVLLVGLLTPKIKALLGRR